MHKPFTRMNSALTCDDATRNRRPGGSKPLGDRGYSESRVPRGSRKRVLNVTQQTMRGRGKLCTKLRMVCGGVIRPVAAVTCANRLNRHTRGTFGDGTVKRLGSLSPGLSPACHSLLGVIHMNRLVLSLYESV
jgi:hypothetical protein